MNWVPGVDSKSWSRDDRKSQPIKKNTPPTGHGTSTDRCRDRRRMIYGHRWGGWVHC